MLLLGTFTGIAHERGHITAVSRQKHNEKTMDVLSILWKVLSNNVSKKVCRKRTGSSSLPSELVIISAKITKQNAGSFLKTLSMMLAKTEKTSQINKTKH